jgi:hypothetical protein
MACQTTLTITLISFRKYPAKVVPSVKPITHHRYIPGQARNHSDATWATDIRVRRQIPRTVLIPHTFHRVGLPRTNRAVSCHAQDETHEPSVGI